MTKILVRKNKEKKEIALVENGKLIEYYDESENEERNEGNIYIGIVKDIIKGMQSAFVNIGTEKNSFIHLKDILPKVDETKGHKIEKTDIFKVIKPKQKILVQVKKDSNSKKGARVSTHINLPSKYIVLMPNTNIVTASQKIENKEEQARLIKLVRENLSKENGAVIRTSAEGKTEEIIEDIKKIENTWQNIIQTSINPNENKPELLYKSKDIIEKILMDLMNQNIEKIIVNNNKEKEKIENIIKENKEYKNIKVEMKKQGNLFEIYDIEKQIKKSQNRKVWLKCGGFITIDNTEALTAIDVNTGKFTGTNNNLQSTILKVNEEATIEIKQKSMVKMWRIYYYR